MSWWTRGMGLALALCLGILNARAEPFMIVGNDEKVTWDDEGKLVVSPAGRDNVLIVDLANPEDPKIVASLPLKNSVVGPPVNLAIDPTGSVALVADSMTVVKDGEALKQAPDDKLYVIDLKANPPKLAGTVTVGKQPSGLDINAKGDRALVALRADNAIGVLAIQGTDVKLVDTVPLGDVVAHVAFTPVAGAPWR
jgi:DNA-binding beta-propeller fold protein YncE